MIRLKTLIEQSQPPKDQIIDIKGSAPYYTVIYRPSNEQENYKIEFEDYELEDQLDNYTWDGGLMGVDQHGGEWTVSASAVVMGGGDYDWEVDWDTIEYQGKPKPNVKKQ